ncbi:hypothetical protein E4S40_06115 [Algoriphagus kandeliae]|uniref:Lipocalin-like domain-containing protein n=1 Tax=Algoriphagus kandeliae TaxID=2562278 RepID=A0A4Y9QXS9_9BACT|nr:hypothetical protein [Algoriphagus kandeliae]TFV95795.1 hypothetical protein E4S40_06115 [Algoriphagus kandeliae]
MKKALIFWAVLVLFSCTGEESPSRTEENLFQTLTSGQWGISYFEDGGSDRASDFEGINFNFLSNGQVEAFRGTQLLDLGIWSTSIENRRAEIELSFPSNPLFENLNGNWYQILIGYERVSFRKDNEVSEDRLTFEKL